MRRRINMGRGGFPHLFVAAGIMASVAMTSLYGESLNTLIEGKSMPARVATTADRSASCAANTVDTIVGTLGCGSTRKGAHLSSISFLSALKKN